jgi:hypothetical protein
MTIKYKHKPNFRNGRNGRNGYWIYQPFPFSGPPKITQIGIFGLKIYPLATLAGRERQKTKLET